GMVSNVKNVEISCIIAQTAQKNVIGLFITMVGTFSHSRAHAYEAYATPILSTAIHRYTGWARESKSRGGRGEFLMTFGPSEAAIDEIVASCNGDLRGAVKALLLVNEHLEAEIAQLYAAAAHYGFAERGGNALH